MDKETKRDIIEIARGYIGAILFMILMWTGVVSAMYAGESETITLEEDFEYYSIVGNQTPINLTLTQEELNVTITIDKYQQEDSFTLIFFNKEKETITITDTVYTGGGGGGSTRTRYIDRNIIKTIPVYNDVIEYIDKDIPVEIIIKEYEETGYKLWHIILTIILTLVLAYILLYIFMQREDDEMSSLQN